MLAVSKILKSDGTDGGVLVGLPGPEAEEIKAQGPVFIFFDGLPVPFFIDGIRAKGSRCVLRLSGVDSLQDAEEIVGRTLYVEGDEAAEEEEGFLGWTVYDRDRRVGQVDGLEEIPGNPCLRISGHLVPLHEDFILRADPQHRELYLDLPEGLLQLDENAGGKC